MTLAKEANDAEKDLDDAEEDGKKKDGADKERQAKKRKTLAEAEDRVKAPELADMLQAFCESSAICLCEPPVAMSQAKPTKTQARNQRRRGLAQTISADDQRFDPMWAERHSRAARAARAASQREASALEPPRANIAPLAAGRPLGAPESQAGAASSAARSEGHAVPPTDTMAELFLQLKRELEQLQGLRGRPMTPQQHHLWAQQLQLTHEQLRALQEQLSARDCSDGSR